MLTNIPVWIKSSLFNWVELGKSTAALLDEKTEWERRFDEAIDSAADPSALKAIGRSGIPSELRRKVILEKSCTPSYFTVVVVQDIAC